MGTLYGHTTISFKNLAASSQQFNGLVRPTMFFGTRFTCPGEDQIWRWTGVNLGTINLTFNQQVVLRQCASCVGSTVIRWTGGTVNNRNHFTWVAHAPTPFFGSGIAHNVAHIVDDDNLHGEFRENDNAVLSAATFARALPC